MFLGEEIHFDATLQNILAGDKIPWQSIYTFEDLRRELISRKYSNTTVKAYMYYNSDLLIFAHKSPSDINESDIKDYLFYLAEEKQSATSTINQAINALKFYYGIILKKKFLYEIKRPRKDKKLPIVLSKEEVGCILLNTMQY